MATAVSAHQQQINVQQIRTPGNVRELDREHVAALATSIQLQGLLVPLVVRPADDGYELVAGFHRFAAIQRLGAAMIDTVAVVVRDVEHEDADRAVENITRKQLRPDEEARAVKAMLDRGYTQDGAAQALGWPKARVTARVKLLALPDRAIDLIGAGHVALSAVDQLLAIGKTSALLLEAVIDYLTTDPWAAGRLATEPGWVLHSAIRAGNTDVFAEWMSTVDDHDVAELKLGKKADAGWQRCVELCKQLDRYAYGARIAFDDSEIDQARAAGVTIEFENRPPIIVDRKLYRELVKQAITRGVTELERKVADRDAERKQSRSRAADTPADPVKEADREHRRQRRELADQAHGVNLDLGAGLLNGLSVVDPEDMNVARFFVYAALGEDWTSGSVYGHQGERVHALAMRGIRLVIDDFREDVTKTLKNGQRGRQRIAYGDPHKPDTIEPAVKWLWRYIDAARTAAELYGRALVVICAEQHACRLVVPSSQQAPPIRYGSHGDRAQKALTKLAGPHLPASLKQLRKAIDAVDRDYQSASTPVADDEAVSPGD
jgi:ParB/RepB/Spo0J family partition protein